MMGGRSRPLVLLALAYAALGGLLALCRPAGGQEIVGPASFAEHDLADYRVAFERAEGERVIAFWEVPAPLAYRELGADGDALHVTGPPGSYTLRVRLLVGRTFEDARRLSAALPVEVTPDPAPDPTPPGPRPPIPPGPGPPGPPAPDPAPIPLDGLRVLIVYESKDATRLPPGQRLIFTSGLVRTFLNESCVKGPDGRTPEWRLYDQDTPVENELPHWRDALARPRASVPWLVVSNGEAGFEGPLPDSVAEFMAVVTSFAE